MTLSQYGNVTAAAEAAGTSPRTAYTHRDQDPEFAAAWNEALEQAADRLEREAFRRAHDGVEEPVTSNGRIVRNDDGTPLMVRKYSDTLLIFLMKGIRPEKYRENIKQDHSGEIHVSYTNHWKGGSDGDGH